MHESVAKAVVSPKGPLGSLLLVALLFPAAAWSQDPLPVNPFGPAKQAEKPSGDEEPPRLNPFGPVKRDRDDAAPGYVEMSDGRILVGDIYMTRDKRLKVYDPKMERQRKSHSNGQTDRVQGRQGVDGEGMAVQGIGVGQEILYGQILPRASMSHDYAGRRPTLDGELAEILYVQPYGNDPDKPLADRPTSSPSG